MRASFAALALLALLGLTSSAKAQMTLSITEIQGRDLNDVGIAVPFNLAECEANALITFLFNTVPTSASVIDIWRGTDCSYTGRTSTTQQTCTHVGAYNSANQIMFSLSIGIADLMPCEDGTNQTQKLWFFAATMAQTQEMIDNATFSVTRDFTVDAAPPAPPSSVSTGNGNTAVPVTWTEPSEGNLLGYRIVIEPITDGTDTTCGTATLMQGAIIPDGANIAAEPGTGATRAVIDPSAFGVPVDGYAAVTVISKDRARNYSVAANVACLHRVPTEGFWGRYEANGGDANTCSVGAPGASGANGASDGWLVLVGLGVAVVVARRRKAVRTGALLVAAFVSLAGSSAQAWDASSENVENQDDRRHESPEHFAIEFRVGGLTPRVGNAAFRETFGDGDIGPLIQGEFDVMLYRIPYIGPLYLGAAIGNARYSAKSFSADGTQRTDEDTTLDLLPSSALVVLRIDTLARQFGLPFVFTGKFGADFIYWWAKTGSVRDAQGFDIALRWGAQLGFELDFLDRAAARALDEAWGLNHAFIFGEILGDIAVSNRPLVRNTIGWTAGLGFTF